MEVPRLGIESELQLPAYTTATAMPDQSHVCGLNHSSQQRRILNSLSKTRDGTRSLMVLSRIHFCCATMGTPVTPFEIKAECSLEGLLFFFLSFFFLGLHLQHMEVPRLGVKLELQLPAYATAMPDLSRVCDLHHRHGNAISLTYWARPGIAPASSWMPVRFISTESRRELPGS